MIFLYVFLSALIFWLIFVNVMIAKDNRENIPKIFHPFLILFAVFGLVYDVVFNLILGTIIFLELPKEWTLTHRMQRLLLTDDTYRFKLALFVCRKLVEPWDPDHCGLSKLK